MNVSLVSLGCPKNTVDSEHLLRGLGVRGIGCAPDLKEADILLVNTCGFIEEAKRESIEEILKLARLKGGGKRLLVFGCLAERYRRELREALPEIDALFGVGEEEAILRYCLEARPLYPPRNESAGGPRPRPVSTYVKVAEGCDRQCTFCVIPSIRGPFRSLSPESILREAEAAVQAGSRELVLVAQDLTGYGKDLRGYGLRDLVRDLASLSGDFWVRLLYLHPASIDEGLLEVMAEEEKVCAYVDMPLQHSEERVLRLMRRGGARKRSLELVGRIRRAVPGVVLRTTLLVGFPGEGEEEFRGLREFVREAEFDRLGVFCYSREEDTPAASYGGQVPKRVKEERRDELMRLQADISFRKNQALVGRRERVLVDELDGETALGRIASQAPEVDGVTWVRGGHLKRGEFVDVRVTGASHYDLEGVPAPQ